MVADVVIVLINGQRLAVEDVRNYHHVVITHDNCSRWRRSSTIVVTTDQVHCFQK